MDPVRLIFDRNSSYNPSTVGIFGFLVAFDDDPACGSRATRATFRFAFRTIRVRFYMNDERAAVFVKDGQRTW